MAQYFKGWRKFFFFDSFTYFTTAINDASHPRSRRLEAGSIPKRTSAISQLSPANIDLLSSLGFGFSFGRIKTLGESLKILGIFHLLVLSGAQISIIASAIEGLSFMFLRLALVLVIVKPTFYRIMFPAWKFLAAIGVIYYLSLTNMTPPVQRAALMFLCGAYARNFGLYLGKVGKIRLALVAHLLFFPINFFSFSTLLTWLCFFYLVSTHSILMKSKVKKYFLLQTLNLSLIAVLFGDVSFIGYILNFLVTPVFTFIIFLAFCLTPLPAQFLGSKVLLSSIDYILGKFSVVLIELADFARQHRWLYLKIPSDWLALRLFILLINISFFFFLFKQLNTSRNTCYDICTD